MDSASDNGLKSPLAVTKTAPLIGDEDSKSIVEWIAQGMHLLIRRILVRSWHLAERAPAFLKVVFSRKGLGCVDGWILLWGKLRRFTISLFPPLVRYFHRRYGLSGGCIGCGASCKMLVQCAHWDDKTHLCKVYEDRPKICRTFPITPADIRDRNLAMKDKPCGFTFVDRNAPPKVSRAKD